MGKQVSTAPVGWSSLVCLIRIPLLASFGNHLLQSTLATDPSNVIPTRSQISDAWTSVATNQLPAGRDEAGAYEHQGRLCMFGGRGILPIDCFNPTTGMWSASETMTQNLHHVQPVVWRDEVWIVAGWVGDWPNTERDIEQVLIYNPQTDQLRTGCAIPEEFQTGAAGVVVYSDMIYVVAGASNGHLKMHGAVGSRNFTRFNPESCEWFHMPVKPQYVRDHFQAVLVGSTLVLAGGRDSARSDDPALAVHWQVAETELFDLSAPLTGASWRVGANIPTPRSGTASVTAGGLVLVIGGETDDNIESAICPTWNPNLAWRAVEAYDLGTNVWQVLPNMLVGRHACGAASFSQVVDGYSISTVWVASGVACLGGEPLLQDVEKLALPGLAHITQTTSGTTVYVPTTAQIQSATITTTSTPIRSITTAAVITTSALQQQQAVTTTSPLQAVTTTSEQQAVTTAAVTTTTALSNALSLTPSVLLVVAILVLSLLGHS